MVDDEGSHPLFDVLLTWLDPDREKAWEKYQTIHETLIKIFTWRGCRNAEDLAHASINRVEQKMPGLKGTYKGDPARYFYGVARNIIHEYWREESRFSEFQDDNEPIDHGLTANPANHDEEDQIDERQQCLSHCLDRLSDRDRSIVLSYYQYDQKTKLEERKQIADELGMTMNALWIRVSRIRASLAACIKGCLNQKRQVQ